MGRPTGPGKIESLASNAAPVPRPGARADLAARLFNFDIDDARLKAEHQEWLRSNVVAAFRRFPGSGLFLQGSASRSGANAHNLDLSRRRVEAVRRFVADQGVPAGQILTSFTGEELSSFRSSEDERDRAVTAVLLSTPATPVRFRPHAPREGFEESPDPARQLDRLTIGVGESKEVDIDNGIAVGVLTTGNPAIASVRPNSLPIQSSVTVLGTGGGSTLIEARDPSGAVLLARLLVVVKPAVRHAIAIHVVRDNAGHSSQRGTSSIQLIVTEMNDVYRRQANVSLVWDGSVNLVTVARDLGDKIESAEGNPSDEWLAVTSLGAQGARCRVFFVHDFDFTNTAKEELGGVDGIPGRDAMIGDDTPQRLETKAVAHEVGHLLGLRHAAPDQLMGTDRVNAGLRISAAEADLLNPTPGPPLVIPQIRI